MATPGDQQLAESLKGLYATSFSYYLKAHGFHFNVEGSNFPQYHEFFGDLYADVYGTIDRIGEYIRTLESYTPFSLTRLAELSEIRDQIKIPRARLMFEEILGDTEIMINCLHACFDLATANKDEGIANFLAERLDAMTKWRWQIRSILKQDRE